MITEPRIGLDDSALAELDSVFRQWRLPMVRLAFVITHDASVAEEIVQEAFLKLYRCWGHVDNPVGYLRTTVVHGCHSHHRRIGVRRRVAVPSVVTVALPPEPPDVVLAHGLRKLTEAHRVVLTLRYFGNLTDDEIAAALGVRPATVRSRVHRALACLRKEIEQ